MHPKMPMHPKMQSFSFWHFTPFHCETLGIMDEKMLLGDVWLDHVILQNI